jgi:hypothetical protein
MKPPMKPLYVIIIAIILILPGLAYVYSLEEDEEGTQLNVERVLDEATVQRGQQNGTTLYLLDIEPSDPDFPEMMHLAATLTPLFVGSAPGEEFINPLIIGTEEKGVETITSLTDREVVTLTGEDIVSSQYVAQYSSATTCFWVSSYRQALAISPTASLTGIPILTSIDPTAESTMKSLGVKRVIAIGDAKVPGGRDFARIQESELNDLFLDLLTERGLSSDYIVVTNPDDIIDYQDSLTKGNLPVAGLSLLSAELAAFHHAQIYFGPGLPTFDETYGDGFTQLGVSREVNNDISDQILAEITDGVGHLTSWGMEAKYLALVGGPVTLPMYYWDINDYQQERQYQPCDYFYADLNDDPYQELAVGRIFARSLTDASLLVLRALIYEEVIQYDYPRDESSTIYDTVSEDWKENSLACVGTTKIGPMPGILTPTLANQTITMTEAGYHVTSMGYDLATQAEIVREIIDEMNYAVYYGHGDYDCWYSTVPDPIDADMLNSVDLKPGFGIVMACLTGMTDSVDIPLDQMISLAFLHSGFAGYIGATRVAYGLYDYEIRNDGAICGTGALYLVDVFSDLVCAEDMNVGEAMREAKNDLIYKDGWDDEEVQITVTQYVLYGDPAHNLWVPEHDG